MHHIQCALFLCSGHYEISLTELPLAISKATTKTFVFHSSSWYQIQPDIRHVSDILQDQSTTTWHRQAYISNTDYLALSIISHLYIDTIPGCVSREALSWRSYMEICTGVDHPGTLFTCRMHACSQMNKISSSLVAIAYVPFSSEIFWVRHPLRHLCPS